MLSGDVVFLCGAGISAPQLPGFEKLVKQCFERLHMDMSLSEKRSFEAHRYEEALGSLRRRIVNPHEMTDAIVHLLTAPAVLDLGNHRTILRLSRDLDNRPLIVTTNFDTLLEQALLERESSLVVRALSSAGQDLPAPGGSGFQGIIHLHGRLAAPAIDLQQTPLVITSADYGDAYMRSGWASRFLFDLCRCKTIVLVGYSAGDAPVRYFLSLLEADRERFPELRRVYAFDGVKAGARADAEVSWGALAVEPIAYEDEPEAAGKGQHIALWRDLAQLAELVERPSITRGLWARQILGKPFAIADAMQTDRIAWLFHGSQDLWPVALDNIEDSAWLTFFQDRKLWLATDAAWVVASWMSRDFQSASRLIESTQWLDRLGEPFSKAIADRLRQAKELPVFWLRAWRLITIAQGSERLDWADQCFMVEQSLKSPVLFHADLEKAVDLLTPTLQLGPRYSEIDGGAAAAPERLNELMSMSLNLPDMGGASSLLKALSATPKLRVILALATARLQSVVQLAIDMQGLEDEYDINDYSVPSVEPHEQNAHHDGPVFLVQLLAELLSAAGDEDRTYIRSFAGIWRAMPGVLGTRLWLHALRQQHLFTADEAMAAVETLELSAFWATRRELALVLRDRAADADAAAVAHIEQRILSEGGKYYSQYSLEGGQTDWRDHARDAGVWLRLNMLAHAGRLTDAGVAELAAIRGRHDHLDRDVEDGDFFGFYSTGIRTIQGDPSSILDADAEDRLKVARDVVRSADMEKNLGWNAYCRVDSRGAFDMLVAAPLDLANAQLWDGLIGALCFPEGEQDARRLELVHQIFNALRPASDSVLAVVVRSLVDLYWSTPRTIPTVAAWWPRLFNTVTQDDEPLRSTRDLYSQAINSAGGRLTQAALLDIETSVKTGGEIEHQWIVAIETAVTARHRQGAFARATLVYASGFLVQIKAEKVLSALSDALGQDTTEAAELRSILVNDARTSSATSQALHRHILRGVLEIGKDRHRPDVAASKIIAPALSIIRGEPDAVRWGISFGDTAFCLRHGPQSLRDGAALLLKNWIHDIAGGPAQTWRVSIQPLLNEVWPRERTLRGAGQALHFAELAIASREAFPEALQYLLPFISPGESSVNIYQLEGSSVPEEFPQETLALLWRIFGLRARPEMYGIATILDRLVAATPAIEFDRRLQSLNQRVPRY